MAAAKIKKGDSVVVLSGKDKGKTGTVAKVMPKDGKIVVDFPKSLRLIREGLSDFVSLTMLVMVLGTHTILMPRVSATP